MKNVKRYLDKNKVSYEVQKSNKEGVSLIFVKVEELNKKPNVVRYIKNKHMWNYSGDYEYITIYVEDDK